MHRIPLPESFFLLCLGVSRYSALLTFSGSVNVMMQRPCPPGGLCLGLVTPFCDQKCSGVMAFGWGHIDLFCLAEI